MIFNRTLYVEMILIEPYVEMMNHLIIELTQSPDHIGTHYSDTSNAFGQRLSPEVSTVPSSMGRKLFNFTSLLRRTTDPDPVVCILGRPCLPCSKIYTRAGAVSGLMRGDWWTARPRSACPRPEGLEPREHRLVHLVLRASGGRKGGTRDEREAENDGKARHAERGGGGRGEKCVSLVAENEGARARVTF